MELSLANTLSIDFMNSPFADTVTVFLVRLYFFGIKQRIQKFRLHNNLKSMFSTFLWFIQTLKLLSLEFQLAIVIRLQQLSFHNIRRKSMPSPSKSIPNKDTDNVLSTLFTLYVSHLPVDITREDLIHLFSLCGQVLQYTSPIAFVDFLDSPSKEKAKKFIHLKKLGDKILRVKDSKYPYNSSMINDKNKAQRAVYFDDKQTVYADDSREQEPIPKKKFHPNPSQSQYDAERSRPRYYDTQTPYRHKPFCKNRDYSQRGRNSHGKEKTSDTNTTFEPHNSVKDSGKSDNSIEY